LSSNGVTSENSFSIYFSATHNFVTFGGYESVLATGPLNPVNKVSGTDGLWRITATSVTSILDAVPTTLGATETVVFDTTINGLQLPSALWSKVKGTTVTGTTVTFACAGSVASLPIISFVASDGATYNLQPTDYAKLSPAPA